MRFYLRLSADREAAASGVAGFDMALSGGAEAPLLDWIPADSRLCAARFGAK